MATNVSALRVQITGNASGLEATLTQGAARVKAFANTVRDAGASIRKMGGFAGTGDILNRELSQTQALVTNLASAYVSGGKVTREQLDAAIAKERQLQQQLTARKALIDSLRGTGANLTELRGAAAFRPDEPRAYEAQLSRVRQLIKEVSEAEVRTGQSRATQLQRLIRFQAVLNEKIAERSRLVARVTDEMMVGPRGTGAASFRERRSEEEQLGRVRQLIQQVAADEVRTGENRATQIQRLIRLESSLAEQIERRGRLISQARDDMLVGPRGTGAAAMRETRTYGEQLSATRQRIRELAEESVRTGNNSSAQIARLTRLAKGLEIQVGKVNARAGMMGSSFANAGMAGSRGMNSVAGGSGRAAMAVQQLGFGMEDFLTQIGPMGIGGGLRAAGNNLSFVASMFNPVLGIVVGIGTALGSILVPKLIQSTSEAEKLSDQMRRLSELRFEMELGGFRTPDVPGRFSSNEELNQSRKAFKDQIKEQEDLLSNARREFMLLAKEAMPLDFPRIKKEIEQVFDQGSKLGDTEFFKVLPDLERSTAEAARNAAAILKYTGAGKLFGVDTGAFGPGVMDEEMLKEFTEVSKRSVTAASNLAKLREAQGDIPQGKVAEWLSPMGDVLSEFANEFSRSINEFVTEQRKFSTDFLGEIGGPGARKALTDARLSDTLGQIGKLFPGDANAEARKVLGAEARRIAEREARGDFRSQGLAGGAQRGSRDAVSLINKALFSSNKTEDKIEKNTQKATELLNGILKNTAPKNQGNDLIAGPPIL